MNCTELGYKVGDKFEVVSMGGHGLSYGEIITLIDDDGSEAPEFQDYSGLTQFVALSCVKSVEVKKTLLEILVDELPKRGGWPEGANCIAQDPDHQIMPSGCRPEDARWTGSRWILNGMRTGSFGTGEAILATDYKTAIITRDQYEAALAEKGIYTIPVDVKLVDGDGWIKWDGGECPVEEGVLVDVKCRDGSYGTRLHAGMRSYDEISLGTATAYDWSNEGVGGDIVAYRMSVQNDDAERTCGDDEEAQPEKPTPKIETLTDAIIEYGCEANLAYPLAKHLLSKGFFK